ncbi:MAG: redoxin domain-containing protein [Verrucomicrobiales bacterium]|nr:redoxin domain-containing protein [Verrucomicrobiales bacterium]
MHGEAFNEGPRQRAQLMPGMPRIQFPVSTAHDLAQQFFNQGVGQLHGFWYLEAERTFRQVNQLDPACAMAFWGMAMANVRNESRARAFLTNAVALKASATLREQGYINALAEYYVEERDGKKRESKQRRRDLVRAYEDLVRRFPEDIEAKAFLVYQVWDNSGFGNNTDLPVTSHLTVDTVARQVLERDPYHPVHHYRIHLWDAEDARHALDSAALCGQGAPGIAHLWHMPGHTYAKLSRHDDAAWQQEASARVDHAQMRRDRLMPDQIHNYTHNNDWLVESWSYVGRVKEALALARNLVELPRLSRTNAALASSPLAFRYDFGGSSWARGRERLLQLLPQFERWDELLALSETPYLAGAESVEERVRLARAVAVAGVVKGDTVRVERERRAIEEALSTLRDERRAAMEFAERKALDERKPREEVQRAMSASVEAFGDRVERFESYLTEIRVRQALAAGDTNTALPLLDRLKDVPTDQMALLRWQAGDRVKALEVASEAAVKGTNRFHPRALHADLLWRAGRVEDAKVALEVLRQSRVWPDVDLPILERLKPIAEAAGFVGGDWRVRPSARLDVGDRPSLDELGPRHWQPVAAPALQLPDVTGRMHGLAEHRGRGVVVLFYLGKKCLHCLEQLNAFAAALPRFKEAGLDLMAVSTDDGEALRRTFRQGGAESFPFPLLSNPDLGTFKAWRAYDDFEDLALHGTYVVDGEGLVRWQDIGSEPFMEVDFLLAEARRLLSFNGSLRVAGMTAPK